MAPTLNSRASVAVLACGLSLGFANFGCSDANQAAGSDDGFAPSDALEDDEESDSTTAPGRGKPGFVESENPSPLPSADAGNGDADKAGPPTLLTLQLACDMQADARCLRLETCAPYTLRSLYGKFETCRARFSALCAAEAALPETGQSTFSLVKCTQEINGSGCDGVLDDQLPEPCRPTGGKREGEGCAAHSQCTSGFCNRAGNETKQPGCGTCQARRIVNEACAEDAACGPDLTCVQGKCLKPGSLGTLCDDRITACQSHLACVNGKCSAPLVPGAVCSSTRQCTRGNGHVCAAEQARLAIEPQNTCRMTSVATAGEVCQVGGNIVVHCFGGPANCAPDSSGTYRCVKVARDGELCGDSAQQTGCEAPARCVGGICRLAPAAGCGQ